MPLLETSHSTVAFHWSTDYYPHCNTLLHAFAQHTFGWYSTAEATSGNPVDSSARSLISHSLALFSVHAYFPHSLRRKMRRRSSTTLSPIILKITPTTLIIIVAILLIWIGTTTMLAVQEDQLVAYDLAEGVAEPEHLTPINATGNLVARSNLYSIDEAHRQGLIHSGAWIWIEDIDGKVLVLKRGPGLVTCPNSYSLVGEHTQGIEDPHETWRRAIREELGEAILGYIKSVEQLPDSPLYYVRDYGQQNSNRIDRQLTYLWWIKMDRAGIYLPIEPDAEVAYHDWIEVKTLQEWLHEAHENLASHGSVGSRLCHETIVTLWETVLKGVQRVNPTRTTN